jgi:hypothetical protein
MWGHYMGTILRVFMGMILLSALAFSDTDRDGREIVYGPIIANQPLYSNIHVISNSYGIIAKDAVRIENVVIEAPVCVLSSGYGLRLVSSDLYCELGVEFTDRVLMNNEISNNRVAGQLTNRPDVF